MSIYPYQLTAVMAEQLKQMRRIHRKISSHERRWSATNSCVKLLILLGWLHCSLISRPLWFRFNLYY